MAKVNPLPVEPLQPQLEPQYPVQPRYAEQQPPALAQPQEPPRAPSDAQVQLWLDPQLKPPQQPVVEQQPYLQLRPPKKPAEHALSPDSQHSWTVAGAAAWNIFCCSLLRRGMPVMFHAVGETFATTAKGSVAWTNAFIYSLAYTLSPVTMALCSMMPLRLLSVAGALLIGVGQIVCYALGSLSLVVPAIAVSCGTSRRRYLNLRQISLRGSVNKYLRQVQRTLLESTYSEALLKGRFSLESPIAASRTRAAMGGSSV